jgi:hypothetical protein
MTTPATRTTRSHLGIPIESILSLIRGVAFAVPSLDYTTFFRGHAQPTTEVGS